MTAMTDLSPAAMEQAWDAYNFEEASNGFTDDRAAHEAAILAYLAALPVQEVTEAQVEAATKVLCHIQYSHCVCCFPQCNCRAIPERARAALIAARGV